MSETLTVPLETGRSLLRERAYHELKQLLIISPRPLEPFLSERKLAKHLGMSNTPVRSAIERLEAEGFITISPNQGIVVRELTEREIADHYDLRAALEPYVLGRLAGKLTGANVERINANLAAQRESVDAGDISRLIELDSEFHLLFCEFLGNDEITRTLLQLRDKIHRIILRIAKQAPERIARTYPEHLEIARAVLAGDAARAADAVIAHLEFGKRCFV